MDAANVHLLIEKDRFFVLLLYQLFLTSWP